MSSEEQEGDHLQIPPYQRRQKKSAEAWEEIRKELLHGAVASISIPNNSVCIICHKEAATVLCRQCGNGYYCEACAINLHSTVNILHAPVIQKVYFITNGSFTSFIFMTVYNIYSLIYTYN